MLKGLISGIVTGALVVAAIGFLLSMATPVPRQAKPETANEIAQARETTAPQVPVSKSDAPETLPTPAPQKPADTASLPRATEPAATSATQGKTLNGANNNAAPPSDIGSAPAQVPATTAPAPVSGADVTPPRMSGLRLPTRDRAPGDRINTAPGNHPNAATGPAAPPQQNSAPASASAVSAVGTADRVVLLPVPERPSGPAQPRPETAPTSPGLPGRAVQSTGVELPRPSDPGAERPRLSGSTTARAAPSQVQPALTVPGGIAGLPQIGGTDTRPAAPAPVDTPATAPAAATEVAKANPQAGAAALPRVNRPIGDGSGLPGEPARRGGSDPVVGPDVAATGPSAPAAPQFENQALPKTAPRPQDQRRLPQIGNTADEGPKATEPDADPGPGAASTPLALNAEPFENPGARPALAVILRDIGAAGIGRARLAALDLPVTIAIDPTAPDAAAAAATYRAAGKEVVVLATGLPGGATASDIEISLEGMFQAVPQAVALLNPPSGGFQSDRIRARQIVQSLGARGYGLVTYDRGLNAAAQIAGRDGVPAGRVFRVLDGEGESDQMIRRYLDRAAFRAAQQGWALVLGDSRAETVAALLAWAMEGRGATLAFAPVSAVLDHP